MGIVILLYGLLEENNKYKYNTNTMATTAFTHLQLFLQQAISFLGIPIQCFQTDYGLDFSAYDKSTAIPFDRVSFPNRLSIVKQDAKDHHLQQVYFFVLITC
jgi:hypothetical protein